MPATIQSIHRPTRARGLDTSTSIQKISSTNLVTNGAFGSDSDWTYEDGGGWDIIGAVAVFTGSLYKYIGQSVSITAGKMYKLTFTITTSSGNPFVVILGGEPAQHFTSAGTYTIDIMAGSDNTELRFYAGSTGTRWNGTVDNVELYAAEAFRNNNHAQIYSGRALEFDGVSDYLSVGTSGDKKFVDYTAETTAANRAWTVAVWFNFDAVGTTVQTLSGVDDSDDTAVSNYLRITSNEKLGFWDLGGAALREANTILNPNTWYRAVFVYNGSDTVNFYLNGVADGSGTLTAGENNNADLNVSIIGGALESSSLTKTFAGKMSDFQAWQGAWTQDDVTYDYLNPEELALNRGGTSLTNSNLKLWYPMNGGHRGQQSFVLDASNTGLSDELLADTDVNNSSSWYGQSVSGSSSMTFSNGEAYSTGSNQWMTQPNVTDHNDGYMYKSVIRAKRATAGSAAVMQVYHGANSTKTHTLTDDYVDYTTYLANDASSGSDHFYIYNASGNIKVTSASLKKINAKNNATTAFYGDNTIVAGNNDRDMGGSNNWDAYGTGTSESVTGGKLTVVTTTANVVQGAELPVANAGTPVVGRTYRIRAKLKRASGAQNPGIIHGSYGGTSLSAFKALDGSPSNGEITDSEEEYYLTLVAENTTGNLIIANPANTDALTFEIDDAVVEEVGIATGWTDADQQLDIPQTALQSYNQLAWFDGVADYTTIADHNDFTFGNGSGADEPFSVSAWVFFNNTTVGYQPIIGKYAAGDRREWLLKLGAASATDGKLNFLTYDEPNDAYIGRKYDTALSSGKWYHVVGTKDDTEANSGFALYINGEKVDDEDHSSGSYTGTGNGPSTVDIGFSHDGNYMNGCITESCIWNKELSQAEVEELYNSGLALDATTHSASSDLIGYWRNNGLATWQDLTSNDRDGTPTSITETMLITEGVDSSRDSQGFLMNRQRTTNSLNLFTNYIADGIGSGERAVVPGRIALGTGDFTVCFWAYKYEDWTNQWVIGQFVDDNNRWYIRGSDASAARLQLYVKSGGNTVVDGLDDTTLLDSYLETWIHVTCVVDRSTDVKWYFNGSHIKTIAVPTGGTPEQTTLSMTYDADLTIGWFAHTSFDDHHFNGQIDDVLIYSDVVSADEVKRIYNAGKRSHR